MRKQGLDGLFICCKYSFIVLYCNYRVTHLYVCVCVCLCIILAILLKKIITLETSEI